MCMDGLALMPLATTTPSPHAPSGPPVDPGLRRFDSLWRSHARRGRLPAMDHVDPAAVGDLIDRLLLVEIDGGGDDAAFRAIVVGEALAGADDPLSGEVRQSLAGAVGARVPWRCGDHVSYPLASNGRDVDAVICIRSAA